MLFRSFSIANAIGSTLIGRAADENGHRVVLLRAAAAMALAATAIAWVALVAQQSVLLIAAAAAARGDLATAEAEATLALKTARETGRPTEAVIVNATVILADVLCKAGRHTEAEREIRQTSADMLQIGRAHV